MSRSGSPPPESFGRRQARTRRFTLGMPGSFAVAPEGDRVAFLRSGGPEDPRLRLWTYEVEPGTEREVADPTGLLRDGEERLPPAERARRERAGQRAGGIVSYATDRAVSTGVFALGGGVHLADLRTGATRALPVPDGAFDPRLDPSGSRVAFVVDGALYAVEPAGGEPVVLAAEEDPDVTWGLAEFAAAEEMNRLRGFWWAPDGGALAVCRVDNRPVPVWHVADPADPASMPAAHRYPAAGTANAEVTLSVVGLDGRRVDVVWDREAFPYLVNVAWDPGSPLTLLVMRRDQRLARLLTADPATGETTLVLEDRDDVWLDVTPGTPSWLSDGRPVTVVPDRGTARLRLGDRPVTPRGLQVLSVLAADERGVLVWATDEPTERHLWRVAPDGATERLTGAPGVHTGAAGGDTLVVQSATLDTDTPVTVVRRAGREVGTIATFAERPEVRGRVALLRAGERALRTALVLPDADRGGGRLPVLLDVYGGPYGAKALASGPALAESRWWADQGFAVLVVDGRGTPARGPAWDRSVHLDLAGTLDDQVEGLLAVAADHPELDLDRVAMRGWSFGGYLAAMAVLRRPDVFHAAVAGAPVTDYRLYDTFYTERYLGLPEEHPDVYERNSLIADAPKLSRPLLLIHGLADDNVYAAHTLRLSDALLAAGRPHQVLPLAGVGHRGTREDVAANLLPFELAFLRRALRIDRDTETRRSEGR